MMFSKKVLAMVFASSLFMSAASAAVVETPAGNLEKTPEISVMLPGFARDNGFMEAGYRGYNRIAKEVPPMLNAYPIFPLLLTEKF